MESLAKVALIFERARRYDTKNVPRDAHRTNKRFSAAEAGSSGNAMQAAAHRVSMSGAAGRQTRVLVISQSGKHPGDRLIQRRSMWKEYYISAGGAMTTKPDEGDASVYGHSDGQQTMGRWERAGRQGERAKGVC
jgi:hypothetical protein